MRPQTDRTLHLHLAVFAAVNALLVSAWAATGAGGGSWPFWLLIVWGSALAVVVARATDGPRA
jgi:2TM domain